MSFDRQPFEPTSCAQRSLMQRLSVESPHVLNEGEWMAHLQACAECRYERMRLERSLAVYRQLEQEFLSETPQVPGWDQFSAQLIQRGKEQRRARRRVWVAASVAASFTLITLGSALVLHRLGTPQSHPARIVRVSPLQREHLLRSLQGILADGSSALAGSSVQSLSAAGANPAATKATRPLNSSATSTQPQGTVPAENTGIHVVFPRSPTVSPMFVSSQIRAGESTQGVTRGGTGFTMFPQNPFQQNSYTPVFPR